jgi:hypothetical protein
MYIKSYKNICHVTKKTCTLNNTRNKLAKVSSTFLAHKQIFVKIVVTQWKLTNLEMRKNFSTVYIAEADSNDSS